MRIFTFFWLKSFLKSLATQQCCISNEGSILGVFFFVFLELHHSEFFSKPDQKWTAIYTIYLASKIFYELGLSNNFVSSVVKFQTDLGLLGVIIMHNVQCYILYTMWYMYVCTSHPYQDQSECFLTLLNSRIEPDSQNLWK